VRPNTSGRGFEIKRSSPLKLSASRWPACSAERSTELRGSPAPAGLLLFMGRLTPSYSSNSFEYNDPAEFERANDFLVRRPIATEHHADH
jgi:hypothetical protein